MNRPRILVIDDVYGRKATEGYNVDRLQFCEAMLLRDVTGDQPASSKITRAVADAVFCRGQRPTASVVGDVVENDLEAVLSAVRQGWNQRAAGEPPWALILLDLAFNTGVVTEASDAAHRGGAAGRRGDDDEGSCFGFRILSALNPLGGGEFHDLPVAILSRLPREHVKARYSRLGAVGFIEGDEPQPMADLLKGLLWRHGLLADGQEQAIAPPTDPPLSTGDLRSLTVVPEHRVVGFSVPLLAALREARRAAPLGANLFVSGATGTGKELLARYLWRVTRQPRRPFVAVDSGALVETLAEDTLFGHVPGAAEGMRTPRTGKIREAHGGDLFLDEIGSLPSSVQLKLLRALSANEVQPLGTDRVYPVLVRYISATDRPVEEWVRTGHFSDALFARLAAVRIPTLPPLDDRREDIPLLVEHFFANAKKALRGANRNSCLQEIDEGVVLHLESQSWPENVRGLRQAVEAAVPRAQDVEYLTERHFVAAGTRQKQDFAVVAHAVSPASERRIPTSRELAERFAASLVEHARSSSTPDTLEYTVSKRVIEQVVRQLRDDGVLARTHEAELERMLGDAWHLLDQALVEAGIRWVSGKNLVRHSRKAKIKALNSAVFEILRRLGEPGVDGRA